MEGTIMRISDDRYTRDRERLDLGLRLIRHEARTYTIRQWTGLSDDRIRKLYRSYVKNEDAHSVLRHRGKSPRQAAFFTRNTRARQESAVLASLCRLIGVLPAAPAGESRHSLAGLGRGELLCQAYESYRSLMGTPLISFEHAVFLLNALWRGDELVIAGCRDCGAVLVIDRWTMRAPCCIVCAPPVDLGHA
jgi:hypothetical protein